jgi:hypothetical protein
VIPPVIINAILQAGQVCRIGASTSKWPSGV